MRSILLHAQDEATFDARLQVALDLTRSLDGHLSIFQAVPFYMVVPTDPYGITMAEVSPAAKAKAKEFRERIEQRLGAEDVRWDWIEEVGIADQQMVEYAALADLVIIGAKDPEGGRGASHLAATLALHCRAPTLVVPDDARGMSVDGPAVVAWNGSLEASRALRAAVPLLARASSVTLVHITGSEERDEAQFPALSGARYLDRHGIDCQVVEIGREGEKVSAVLKRAAELREAGLVVMGAYGVPRLYETVFGGVTKEMLADPKIPVLLTH